MKTEERKKKYIVGIVIYTLGIVQFAVMTVLTMDGPRSNWWMAFVGAAIFIPMAMVAQNLMVLQRWW